MIKKKKRVIKTKRNSRDYSFIIHICFFVINIGLVIIKALYGHLEYVDENEDNDELPEGVIDVTVVLQAMVNESRLTIPSGHSKVKKKKKISSVFFLT